jgi:hypothetical protein
MSKTALNNPGPDRFSVDFRVRVNPGSSFSMAQPGEHKYDPGPVQIQAGQVRFGVSGIPLDWSPGPPVACNVIGLLNIVPPAAERWFVAGFNEAL